MAKMYKNFDPKNFDNYDVDEYEELCEEYAYYEEAQTRNSASFDEEYPKGSKKSKKSKKHNDRREAYRNKKLQREF